MKRVLIGIGAALGLLLAFMVVRTFMEPPGGSAAWRIVSRFQRRKTASEQKSTLASMDGSEMPIACSALEY